MDIIAKVLFYSAIVVVVLAFATFAFLMWKIVKTKKKIKQDQLLLLQNLIESENEQKLIEREDFGQSIPELEQYLKNPIEHEIVEFCINSSIRNGFNKILLIGKVEPYELIAISNKTNSEVFVDEINIDKENLLNVIENFPKIDHKIMVSKSEDLKEIIFDSIMMLQPNQDLAQSYLDNIENLKEKGMFIFAQTKKMKAESKELISKIEKKGHKYDTLKWHKGFIIIVK